MQLENEKSMCSSNKTFKMDNKQVGNKHKESTHLFLGED
jgi:hypothetical protein